MPTSVTPAELAAAIRNVPDFPKPGIQFKDITPVLADARQEMEPGPMAATGHRTGSGTSRKPMDG